jgi:hypothetical protein
LTIGATTTFTESCDEICTDALSKLGVVAPGVDASGARTSKQLLHARRALNALVKSFDKDGEYLWRITRRTVLVSSFGLPAAPTYSPGFQLAADVLDVDGPMTYFVSGQTKGTPIIPMSRDEFMSSDRQSLGIPNRFYVEKAGTQTIGNSSNVYFDPIPTAAGDSIEYAAFTRSADFTSGADTPDFVQKWTRCLVWGLAADLCPDYGQTSKMQSFRDVFDAEKAVLIGDDNERGNLRLVPFGNGY